MHLQLIIDILSKIDLKHLNVLILVKNFYISRDHIPTINHHLTMSVWFVKKCLIVNVSPKWSFL